MTIYVDQFPDRGFGKWCGGGHMLTTDIDELHKMADLIGLKKAWFQDKSFPHYDVTRSKRSLAVGLGAVEIELGELPPDIRMRKRDGTYESRSIRLARRKLKV